MKKLYTLLLTLTAGSCAFAQTVPNAGMETWRTGTSGTSPVFNIQAPGQWYGMDSLIIADGETYGPLIGAGNNWNALSGSSNMPGVSGLMSVTDRTTFLPAKFYKITVKSP